MYYSIAEHSLEIFGEGLGDIPGFSHFLSSSAQEPVLDVRLGVAIVDCGLKPLFEFTTETTFCSISADNGCYHFRMEETDGTIWLMEVCNKEGHFCAVTNMDKGTNPYLLRFALWTAFGIAVLWRKTVAIHASTILYKGKAILFLGESGTGKSTHSHLWLQHIPNTELLNDDSPFICIGENRNLKAWGSPWSGKTPCYKNKCASIAAFVRLRQAPYNQIRRLNTIESIGALLPSFSPMFTSIPMLSDVVHSCLSDMLSQVPVYMLSCLPDADAARLVCSTLETDGWL